MAANDIINRQRQTERHAGHRDGDADRGGDPHPLQDIGPVTQGDIGIEKGEDEALEAAHDASLMRAARCSGTGRPWCARAAARRTPPRGLRSEEHTSELQSLMRISYAVFCLKKKSKIQRHR